MVIRKESPSERNVTVKQADGERARRHARKALNTGEGEGSIDHVQIGLRGLSGSIFSQSELHFRIALVESTDAHLEFSPMHYRTVAG